MDYLAFLLAILYLYKARCEEIFWDTTVKLAKNMSLECVYPSTDTLTQMEWFKIKQLERESIAIFNPTYRVILREPYADRVYFSNLTMTSNDMTLTFHNASEVDIGFYSCFLHTFPHGTWEKVIQVVPSDGFEIAVPSNSHTVSEPGKDVTLTCQPQMERLLQEVMWEKIQPHQIDLLTSCNLSQGRSYTSKYPRQILSNCTQRMRRAFLTMPHVTASDSGLYRCGFKASTGETETFMMRLTITNNFLSQVFLGCGCPFIDSAYTAGRGAFLNHQEGRRGGFVHTAASTAGTTAAVCAEALCQRLAVVGKTNNQYILFVAAGAVLLLLVFLITAAIVVSRKRKRRRQKRGLFKKEYWDTQNRATNNYRSPAPASQPSDGAGEDIYVNYPTFSRRPKTRV